MALALDATSNQAGTSTAPSWSHTCSGSNRYLLVIVQDSTQGTTNTSANTTVKYNGVTVPYLAGTATGQLFYGLVAPATGTNTVAVTNGAGNALTAAAISFTGALQAATTEGYLQVTGNSSGTSQTVGVVVSGGGEYIVGCSMRGFVFGSDQSLSVTSGTAWAQISDGANTTRTGYGYDTSKSTAAGTTNLVFTVGAGHASDIWNSSAIAILPAPVLMSLSVAAPTAVTLAHNKLKLLTLAVTAATTPVLHKVKLALRSFTVLATTAAALTKTVSRAWTSLNKDSSSYTDSTKHSSAYTNAAKDSSAYTDSTKHSSSYTNQTKDSSSYTNQTKL